MIIVKEAVKIARDYLSDLLSESVIGGKIVLILEEVELSDEQPVRWLITFSYKASFDNNPIMQNYFKRVEVLADDGEVRAVKIRSFD